jgi:hypothetical protein
MAMNDISKATQENLKITQATSKLSSSITNEINLLNASMEDLRIILENSKKNKVMLDEQLQEKAKNSKKNSSVKSSPTEGIREVSEEDFNPDEIAQRYNQNIGNTAEDSFNDSDFQ